MKKRYAKVMLLVAIIAAVAFTGLPYAPDTAQAASGKTHRPSRVSVRSIKSTNYDSVTIKWKAARYAKKYEVYRANGKNKKYKKIKTTTARSFTNKKLTTGKKYYFKVRAVRGSRKGKFSKAKACVPKVRAVKISSATCSDFTTIDITWNRVPGATGYKIYRATSKSGKYVLIGTNTVAYRKHYSDMNVSTDRKYYYKVKAFRTVKNKKKKYYSAYSNVIAGSTFVRDPVTTSCLSLTGTRLPDGDVLVKVVNSSDADDAMIRATIKVVYKDAGGRTVGFTVNYLQYIHDLGTSYIRINRPEDKNFNLIDYTDFEIQYEGTLDFGIRNYLGQVSCTDKRDADKVTLTITNNSSVKLDYVDYGVFFYKNDKLIDYNDGQLSGLDAGSTGTLNIVPQGLQSFDRYEIVPIHAVVWPSYD